MRKIGITADCSSGLEYAPFEHHIKITRTTIHFGEETLTDGVDITADQFYDRLKTTDVVPTTSAPTPGEILKRIDELKAEGCTDIIHFPISFGLSNYGKNLESSMEDLIEGVNFRVFNTNNACVMEGYQAKYAEILADKGYSVDEIFEEVAKLRENINTYLVVEDLKYLVKNGRLNATSGMIGSLLKIKPVLNLGKNGTIDTFEKVRTSQKAVNRIVELSCDYAKKFEKCIVVVLHTARLDDANKLRETIKPLIPNAIRFEVTSVTPTVGAHIGCGVLAIAIIPTDGLKEQL